MSTVAADENSRAVPHWIEWIGDRCNPILVKEVRQSLKSKQFVVTFFLLVTAAWLTAVFGMLMWGERIQYEAVGRNFFFFFYVGLAVATLLVVPFGAFQSLKAERDLQTFEALNVTTLTPGQIVTGKLLAAMVQIFIFYSAITPFIAFASTLQGFDTAQAAYFLVVSLLVSMMLSTVALTASTLSDSRVSQGALAVGVLGGLAWAMTSMITYVSMTTYFRPLSLTDREFWIVNGIVILAATTYFVLFRQLAISRLTFESDNHSTGIRLTATAQFWLLWLVSIAVVAWEAGSRAEPEMFTGLAIISAVHWAAFGLAFTAEPDSLSRRIRRGIRGNALWRFVKSPFMPGGARGYMLLVSQTVMLLVFFLIARATFVPSAAGVGFGDRLSHELTNPSRDLKSVVAMCCYLLMYGGLNTALTRWTQAANLGIKPAHVRLITFILMMAAVTGPIMLIEFDAIQARGSYHWIQLFDPFTTSAQLSWGRSRMEFVLPLLTVLTFIAVFVNVPAMFRGTGAILAARSESASRRHPDTRPLSFQ